MMYTRGGSLMFIMERIIPGLHLTALPIFCLDKWVHLKLMNKQSKINPYEVVVRMTVILGLVCLPNELYEST